MVIKTLAASLIQTNVTYKERLQQTEPCIYIANHTSLLDAVVLERHLPKNVVFIANTEIAKRYAWAMKGKEVVAIDPMNPYSIRTIVRVLKEGKSIMIFPEGRITVTNSLMKMYTGVAYLALKTQYKIIPIALNGGEKAKKFCYLEGKIPTKWFPGIAVYVGEPFTIEVEQELTMRKKKEMATHLLYRTLQRIVFESRTFDKQHLAEAFRQRVQEAPNMVIAEETSASITMKDLWRKIIGLSLLFDKKLTEERIGVLLPTSIANIATIYALLYTGKSPALLNFSMDVPTLISCLQTGDIRTILTSRQFIEKGKLGHLVEGCAPHATVLYLEDLATELTAVMKANVLLKENQKVTSKRNDLLLFTSGSEGVPKGVLLTHDNIYANVQQAKLLIPFTSQDKVLNALPMFHSFGMILSFLSTLEHVPTVLVPSPLLYKAIPEIAYSKGATILLGTSTFLAAYGKHAHPYDFYSLRYVVAGAEKCQDHVHELWSNKFGLRILEGYGLTETSPILSLQTPILNKQGSVGCLAPGVDYDIEPVEGIDEGGKLKVKAPNVMKGYLFHGKGFEPTPEWFDTGDIVTMDEKGFVTIQGRSKLFVKIAGEMVSLPLVEQHAKTALQAEDILAIGLSDERKGERIEIMTTKQQVTIQMLRDYWKENNVSPISLPSKIHIVAAIPLLGSGKVDRIAAKKIMQELNENIGQQGTDK